MKSKLTKFLIILTLLALVVPVNLIKPTPKARAIIVDEEPEPAPVTDFDTETEESHDQTEGLDTDSDNGASFDLNGQKLKTLKYLESINRIPAGFSQVLEQSKKMQEQVLGGPGIDKIYFKNPLDSYLIWGEPCVRPVSTTEQPICTQKEGDNWIKGGVDDNGNRIEPHPGDDVFPNNLWDGPKYIPPVLNDKREVIKKGYYESLVDRRILDLLLYLVTPTDEGGAGRERLTISKIADYVPKDREQKQIGDAGLEPKTQKNEHYLGTITPGRYLRDSGGEFPIQAIDIFEIDSLRISTEITKERRVGGDKTSYKFQRPIPLKVAWQSDRGQDKAGVPPLDMMTGSEDMFKAGLIDLLAEFDLGESLTPDDLSDVDLRSIATFIGTEMLSSALGTPKGSLSGFDLGDTLSKMGRFIIADEFGLPREAFATGNSLDDFERNLGQYILEERLNLSHGSLSGQFSSQLVANTGRRWLEEEIFNVAPGTLDYETKLNNGPEKANLMLERLGRGRIAQTFNFNPSKEWFNAASYDELKTAGGLRFSLLFNEQSDPTYIDEYLGIGESFYDANESPVACNPNNMITCLAPDPNNNAYTTSEEFIAQGKSGGNWMRNYFNTIGRYVFQSSIGLLNRQLDREQDLTNLVRGANTIGSLTVNAPDGSSSITANYQAALQALAESKNLEGQALDPTILDSIFMTDPTDPNEPKRNILNNDLLKSEAIYQDALDNPNFNPQDLDTANPVFLISLSPNNIWEINQNRITAYMPRALDRIIEALNGPPAVNQLVGGDLKALTEALQRAASYSDGTDLNQQQKIKKIIDALNKAKEYGQSFLDTAVESRQIVGSSSADGAMGFRITPELLNQIRAKGDDPNASEIANSLALMASDQHSLTDLIQNGDIAAVIPAIGVLKLAERTAQGRREQAAIQVGLFQNLQTFFNNLADLGLSEVQVNGRFGLIDGDYDRLFLRNMSSNVFERIGQAELLAAVWRQPTFQKEIEKVRQNPEYQNLEAAANEANQEIGFYSNRVRRLYDLSLEIDQDATSLDARLANFKTNIQTLINLFDCVSGKESCANLNFQSVGDFKEFIGSLEYNYGNANAIIATERASITDNSTESAQLVNRIQQKLTEFGHIFQEIIEGQELKYDRPKNIIDPSDLDLGNQRTYQKSRQGNCWKANEVVGLLMSSNSTNEFGHQAEDYLKQVGGCELDQKLYLPTGSLYFFYTSSDHSKESLYFSVGTASYNNSNKDLPSDDATIKETGRQVVVNNAVRAVAARSGLFRNISQQYGLTEDDIYLMVTGHSDAVVTRVGSRLIDQRLNLTPGTAATLIEPCSGDDRFKAYLTQTNRNCQDKEDREEIRAHVMAREALRELGLEMLGVPLDVDLTQGNFRDNLGLAKLSRTLGGLQVSNDQNHVYRTLDEVVRANGLSKTMSAFGLPPTPFINLLAELKNRTEAEVNKITPLVQNLGPNIGLNQSQLLQEFNYYTQVIQELERVRQVTEGELWNAIKANKHFYWLPNPASLTDGEIMADLPGKFIYIAGDLNFILDRILKKDLNGKRLIEMLPRPVYDWLNQDFDLQHQPEPILRDQAGYIRRMISTFRGNAMVFQNNNQRLNGALGLGSAYTQLPNIDPDLKVDGKKTGIASTENFGQGTGYDYGRGVDDDDRYAGGDEGHNLQLTSVAQEDCQTLNEDGDNQLECRLPKPDNGNNIVESEEVPSIERVLTEQVGIDDLVTDFGKISMWKMGVDLVGGKFPDSFIGQAMAGYDQFRQAIGQVTMTDANGNQVPVNIPPIEYLFSGKYANTYPGGENAFWTELLTGRSDASAVARSFFFDKFFAHTFTAKFERQAGVSQGTFRDLFARPYLAKELAIDEGLTQLGSQLFRSDKDDSRDMLKIKSALSQVYQAGFLVRCSDAQTLANNNRSLDESELDKMKEMCKTRSSFFTYKFNTPKALGQMQELVYDHVTAELNQALGGVSQEIGITIPLSDVLAIAQGDVNTLSYVAAAFTVTQANREAYEEDHDHGRNFNNSRRAVSYDIARLATVGQPDSAAVLTADTQAQNNFDREFVATCGFGAEAFESSSVNICLNLQYEVEKSQAVNPDEFISPEDYQERYENRREKAGERAAKDENDQVRKSYQEKFKFQMMDIALYKINPNFPLGFAQSFFSSSATDRSRNGALTLTLLSSLSRSTEDWEGFINAVTGTNLLDQNEVGNLKPENLGQMAVDNFNFFLDTVSCTGITDGTECRKQVFSYLATNEGLRNFLNQNFDAWFGDAFGVELKDGAEGLFNGVLAFGISGKVNEDVTYNQPGCTENCERTLVSLEGVATEWATNRIFTWADRTLGFDTGTAKAIYQNGRGLYDAYKFYKYAKSHTAFEVGFQAADAATQAQYINAVENHLPDEAKKLYGEFDDAGQTAQKNAKADFRQAKAQFVTFVVTTIFKSQIASAETKLGLVPGTGSMLVGMLINLAFSVPVDPITIALFIGLNLFGYYKVVVTVTGTADGYYPYAGRYGAYSIGGQEIITNQTCISGEESAQEPPPGCRNAESGFSRFQTAEVKTSYFQYPSPDPAIGEFNGQDDRAYREYLKKAAQAKVEGLLIDIATAPERWGEVVEKDTYDLIPSQVFTLLPEHVDAVQPFISRRACLTENDLLNNGGCGYGQVGSRKYSGFWANKNQSDFSFWDHVHIAY